MVTLGFGQAIMGGRDSNNVVQSKIFHMKCSQHICQVSTLDKELSIPRADFMAIPTPDYMSGCIAESKLRHLLVHVCLKRWHKFQLLSIDSIIEHSFGISLQGGLYVPLLQNRNYQFIHF